MEKRKAHRLPSIGLYMLTLVIVAGCVPAHFRANPQVQEKVQSIKTVAIMPPSVKVYQLAVGGGTQLMDEETVAATQIVAGAIEKELRRHAGVVFKPFPSPSAIPGSSSDLAAAGLKDELEDTQALFEAVSTSVLLHTYEPKVRDAPDQTFPEKLKNFDYSLGPDVERLAQLANANALLFVSGIDNISTGGRKALMALAILLEGALRAGSGPAAGASGRGLSLQPSFNIPAGPMIVPNFGTTSLSVALVDAGTGAILWYNVVGFLAWSSLTDPHKAADLVEEVFTGFPASGRPLRKD